MGCHTWFYKAKQITNEDYQKAKIVVIKQLEEHKNYCIKVNKFYNSITFKESILSAKNTLTDIKQIIIKSKEIFGDVWKDDLYFIDFMNYSPNYIKDIINTPKVCDRQINAIKKNYYKCAVIMRYFDSYEIDKKNNKIYIGVDDFHDVFRKYGYPDDKLFSYDETIKYIENEKNECYVRDKEHTYKQLKDFWDKYPDGMINFG